MSCPDDFLSSNIYGTDNVDWYASYCYKEIDDPDNWTPSEGSLEFGGMAGYVAGAAVNNSTTGGWTCPDGFKMHRFLDTSGVDYAAMYCYKKIPDVTKWKPGPKTQQFGGMWGAVQTKPVDNVATGTRGCPATFADKKILDTSSVDWPLGYCSKPWPSL